MLLPGDSNGWVAILAPPSIARGMSYVTGWFLLTYMDCHAQEKHADIERACLPGVLGIINSVPTSYFVSPPSSDSGYFNERWHDVLIAYLITLIGVIINIYGRRLLDGISRAAIIWNIGSFIIVIVVILACSEHRQQPALSSTISNFSPDSAPHTVQYWACHRASLGCVGKWVPQQFL